MDIRKIYYLCPLKMRGEIPRSKSIRYESEKICALSVYAYPDGVFALFPVEILRKRRQRVMLLRRRLRRPFQSFLKKFTSSASFQYTRVKFPLKTPVTLLADDGETEKTFRFTRKSGRCWTVKR